MIDEEDDDTVAVQIDCENQNTVGNTIFVRDDRKKNEFFHVCEVEVFALNTDPDGESIFWKEDAFGSISN